MQRLIDRMSGHPGLTAHVEGNLLCLHLDLERMTEAQARQIAAEAGADVTSHFGHEIFPLHLVDGEDSGRRVEKSLRAIKGILDASVNLPGQVARVEWDREVIPRDTIIAEIRRLGINAPATTGCCDHSHEETSPFWWTENRELLTSLLAGLFLLTGFLGERLLHVPHGVGIALYAIAYVLGGYDLASHWLRSAIRGKPTFDIDLLMLIAALGAALLGDWAEGAFLLFLFSLAHALEHYALNRARGAISALADLTPETALVRRDGRDVTVPVAEVLLGEHVIVAPGQRVPVDGKVVAGLSWVDQSPITGESIPIEKAPESEVFAGTVNGEGSLEIRTDRVSGERTLDRVIRMVEDAQTQKAPTEQFVERFSRVFVPCVLVADLLLIVVPPLVGLMSWPDAFYRGMALIVAASPCALALGTPSAVLAGLAQAARRGVLVKGGGHLENLGRVRAIAFDKTGTLTVGRPEVRTIAPIGIGEEEFLRIAAAAERRSQHPLAQAVLRRAGAGATDDVESLQSVTGRGVRAMYQGQPLELGSLRLWEGETIPAEISTKASELESQGQSVIVLRFGGKWLGCIGLADQPREGVRETLGQLRSLGIKPLIMLTGDNQGVGEAIGKTVGVDEVKANLLPDDKVTMIRELQARYERVAMVGDGINDAPALANATVGIAMGGAGTAVALETADVALMGDDLGQLPFAVGLARLTSAIIRQNLFIALGVIAVLVITTIGGWMRIGPAVIFHEGSTLVVIANSLRLLGYRFPTS